MPVDTSKMKGSLDEWLRDLPDAESLASVISHLRAVAGGSASEPDDAETVAAYFRPGRRSEAELVRLWEDASLRRGVASVGRVLAVAERARGNGTRVGFGHRRLGLAALLAASVAGVLFVPRLFDVDAHRSASITSAVVEVIGAEGEVAEAPLIRWEPVLGADLYEVELAAADGNMVFQGRTDTTHLQIPAQLVSPGVPYFYRVRARVDVARWVESDFREFIVRP